MKRNNSGFSLVEIVVAMAILGIFATASCTSLVLAHRMNAKTETMLQAQLAVSSAVETLMAEGIDETKFTEDTNTYNVSGLSGTVTVTAEQATAITTDDAGKETTVALPYYEVTVTSSDNTVSVTTQIRKAVSGT